VSLSRQNGFGLRFSATLLLRNQQIIIKNKTRAMTDEDWSNEANQLPKEGFRVAGGFLRKVILIGVLSAIVWILRT